MYLVLFFPNCCCAVPTEWVDKEQMFCWWPPKGVDKTKAIAKRTPPDKQTWTRCPCYKIWGPYETYIIARTAEKEAQSWSTSEENLIEETDKVAGVGKRRIKKTFKVLDNENGDLDTRTDLFEEGKSRKNNPPSNYIPDQKSVVPSDYGQQQILANSNTKNYVFRDISNENGDTRAETSQSYAINKQTCGGGEPYRDSSMQQQFSEHSEPTLKESDEQFGLNDSFNLTDPETTEPNNYSRHTPLGHGDSDDQKLSGSRRKGSSQGHLTVVHPPSSFNQIRHNKKIDRQPPTTDRDNPSNHEAKRQTNSQGGFAPKKQRTDGPRIIENRIVVEAVDGHSCPCCTNVRTLLTSLTKRINYLSQVIESKHGKLSEEYDRNTPMAKNLLPEFPLNTTNMLDQFNDQLLADDAVVRQFKHLINQIGGQTPAKFIVNILSEIMGDNLARDYSWTGRKNTLQFKDTQISKIIIDTVLNGRLGALTTKSELNSSVMEWFHHAGDRWKRKHIPPKKTASNRETSKNSTSKNISSKNAILNKTKTKAPQPNRRRPIISDEED